MITLQYLPQNDVPISWADVVRLRSDMQQIEEEGPYVLFVNHWTWNTLLKSLAEGEKLLSPIRYNSHAQAFNYMGTIANITVINADNDGIQLSAGRAMIYDGSYPLRVVSNKEDK